MIDGGGDHTSDPAYQGPVHRESTNIPDRVPPQSVDLEMCVLGGIMLDPQWAFPIAIQYISPATFYLEGHGLLFRIMSELFMEGNYPDMNVVLDVLRKRELLDKVGGSGVVMGMLNSVPTAANVEVHSKKLAEKYTDREILTTLTAGIDAVYKQQTPGQEIITDVTAKLRKLLDQGTVQVPYISAGQEAREAYEAIDTPLMATVPIGVPMLDKNAGGIAPGEVWGLLAAPNTGKTKIGLSLAILIAMNYETTWLNLEMSPTQWYNYLMPAISSVGLSPLNAGQLFKEPPGAMRDGRWKDVIIEADKLWLRTMHRQQGVDNQLLRLMMLDAIDQGAKVLFIDQYIKILSFRDGQSNDNRGQKAEAIFMVSEICKENNVTGFMLHQSNRSGYDNPGIDSGFDTAAFEQVCDHVLTFVDLQKVLIRSHKGFCEAQNGFPIPPTKANWKELTDGNPNAVLTETTWLRPIDFCLTKTRGEQVGRKAVWFDYSLGCCVEIIDGQKVPMTQSNIVGG